MENIQIGSGHTANILGLSVSTVQRLADQGAIPSTMTAGGHRRFVEADVREYAKVSRKADKPKPNLIRIGRAAKILDVSVDTVRRYTNDGRIPVSVTSKGERRYVESDVRDFALHRQRLMNPEVSKMVTNADVITTSVSVSKKFLDDYPMSAVNGILQTVLCNQASYTAAGLGSGRLEPGYMLHYRISSFEEKPDDIDGTVQCVFTVKFVPGPCGF